MRREPWEYEVSAAGRLSAMSDSAPFQFGLSSMLLITTLVAVIMSVSVMVPGIGIALAVVSVPALLRTYVLIRRKREKGETVTNQDKAVLFVLCLGIAVTIAIATGAAFLVPCLVSTFAGGAIGNSENGLVVGAMIGAISGLVASLALLIYLLRKWFKYPPHELTTGELLHTWIDGPDDAPGEDPASGKASSPSLPPTELPRESTP
jgi:hypothetical protein